MKAKTWTIFGAGNFINDIKDAIDSNGERLVTIVLNMPLDAAIMEKLPASAWVIRIEDFKPSTDHYFLGFIDPNKGPLLESLKKYNLAYSNLVHKFSYAARSVQMGRGNFVGAGAVLAPGVSLGDFNYINRAASIGHNTAACSFNHFGPGCTVSGRCKIGSRNFFGTGSAVIDGLEIGDGITIGAGAAVVKNIEEPGTYVGVPARKIR